MTTRMGAWHRRVADIAGRTTATAYGDDWCAAADRACGVSGSVSGAQIALLRAITGSSETTLAGLWARCEALLGDSLPSIVYDMRTRATLPNTMTFTRASSATRFTPAGAIETVASDVPRFDYHPTTGAPRGLLIEEARTNLFLNSATLATQDVTVTAAAHTISFYGAGTVTLSGAHSATVVGTGAFPTRTTLTFTPSAGTLTCTVSGTVQYAQIELGGFVTSWIPTAGATATRQLDLCTFTLPSTYDAATGTWVVRGAFGSPTASPAPRMLSIDEGVGADQFRFRAAAGTGSYGVQVIDNSATQATVGATTASAGVPITIAFAFAVNDFAASVAGTAVSTDTTGTVPSATTVTLGQGVFSVGGSVNGYIERLAYWPVRLPNATLVELSA